MAHHWLTHSYCNAAVSLDPHLIKSMAVLVTNTAAAVVCLIVGR
jgi:hypothetical protein